MSLQSSTSEIPDLATPLPISRLQLPHFQFNLIPNHHYHHQGSKSQSRCQMSYC